MSDRDEPTRTRAATFGQSEEIEALEPVSGIEAGLYSDAWRQLRRKPIFMISGILILILILMAIWPSLFTRADPRSCKLADSLLRPSSEHWFGTDVQGCDYYARTIYGARVSISIGILVTVCSTLVAWSSDRSRAITAGWSTA